VLRERGIRDAALDAPALPRVDPPR